VASEDVGSGELGMQAPARQTKATLRIVMAASIGAYDM
jgi:hypothetical protein